MNGGSDTREDREGVDIGDQLGLDQLKARMFGTAEPIRRIGRYRVLEELGRGGMGVVLRAQDEQLDRSVALKLLPSEHSGSAEQRARLAREARALAKISHPSVVQIYDVGDIDGSVWVAMEHVEGQTLRSWLDAPQRRPWREVLAVLIEAGEGLCAAHDAGLVHRDFKPDNVMVADDGHARVLDFGLARLGDEPSGAASTPATNLSNDTSHTELTTLTRVGQVAGTPVYMAPECFDGVRADARADQFSFCVTLWEALHGSRPFASHEGAGLQSFRAALAAGGVDAPAKGTPAWLDAAVRRGLSANPDERWPSMDALVLLLRNRPGRGARLLTRVGVGVSVLGALGLGLASADGAKYCEIDEASFDGVWDQARRGAVTTRVRESGMPRPDVAAASITAGLDVWVGDWLETQRQACQDTRVTGIASEARLDAQTHCLERRRRDFRTTVDLFTNADLHVVARAPELLAGLPDLTACSRNDPESLDMLPEESREEIERGFDLLARAEGLRRLGDYADSTALADEASRVGVLTKYLPLELRGRALAARLQLEGDAVEDGAGAMLDVIRAAERAHLDPLVAELRVQLAHDVAGRWSRPEMEAMVFEDAKAWLDRSPLGDVPARELALVDVRLELERGELEQALATLTEIRTQPPPSDALRLREGQLASRLLAQLGHPVQGRAELQELLAELTERWGPAAKVAADIEFDLGLMALESGDVEAATANLANAEEHYRMLFGQESADVVSVGLVRARIALERGDVEAACEALEDLVKRAEAAFGPEHIETSGVYEALGVARFMNGEFQESLSAYEHAMNIAVRAQGKDHPEVAILRSNIGETLAELGQHDTAIEMFELALDILSTSRPPEHPDHAYPLKGLAKSLIAVDRRTEAVPLLERALELHEGERADPLEKSDVLRTLAIAVAPLDRERAGELSREAALLSGTTVSGVKGNESPDVLHTTTTTSPDNDQYE